jgi:hypothetical protein
MLYRRSMPQISWQMTVAHQPTEDMTASGRQHLADSIWRGGEDFLYIDIKGALTRASGPAGTSQQP